MDDQVPETPQSVTNISPAQTTGSSPGSGALVAITAIIALAIVSSCCILAGAIVAFAFFAYAPW